MIFITCAHGQLASPTEEKTLMVSYRISYKAPQESGINKSELLLASELQFKNARNKQSCTVIFAVISHIHRT